MLRQLLEVRRLMRQGNVGLTDALGLLADELRTFADYERQRDEAEHVPVPRWLYGQDAM